MSDSATIPTNKNVVILLAVVVVLLAAIAGLLVFRSSDLPDPTVTGQTSEPITDTSAMPGGVAPTPVGEFDPSTATQVPAETDPVDFVSGYYEAVVAQDWADAYWRQPAHKLQANVDEFSSQLSGYGIVGYEVTGSDDQGEQMVVTVDQQTAGFGTFENQWVFLNFEGTWVVQDKAVTGMK